HGQEIARDPFEKKLIRDFELQTSICKVGTYGLDPRLVVALTNSFAKNRLCPAPNRLHRVPPLQKNVSRRCSLRAEVVHTCESIRKHSTVRSLREHLTGLCTTDRSIARLASSREESVRSCLEAIRSQFSVCDRCVNGTRHACLDATHFEVKKFSRA